MIEENYRHLSLGKLHFMTADRIARRFPRYEDFVQMRRRFDPKSNFTN